MLRYLYLCPQDLEAGSLYAFAAAAATSHLLPNLLPLACPTVLHCPQAGCLHRHQLGPSQPPAKYFACLRTDENAPFCFQTARIKGVNVLFASVDQLGLLYSRLARPLRCSFPKLGQCDPRASPRCLLVLLLAAGLALLGQHCPLSLLLRSSSIPIPPALRSRIISPLYFWKQFV